MWNDLFNCTYIKVFIVYKVLSYTFQIVLQVYSDGVSVLFSSFFASYGVNGYVLCSSTGGFSFHQGSLEHFVSLILHQVMWAGFAEGKFLITTSLINLLSDL